jgi:hypothetical protein
MEGMLLRVVPCRISAIETRRQVVLNLERRKRAAKKKYMTIPIAIYT